MVLGKPATQKILVVDDDLDTLKLVGTTLEKQGFLIVAAKDGQEALDKVAQHMPDLILLDLMMPKMDGYEVTRRLRSDPKTAGIPIILFTAKAQVDDKVAGLEAGADDYLTKPTHPAELVARVRSLLKRPVTSMLPPLPPEGGGPAVAQGAVIGVIAAKGGQGVSTLAINLGSGFLREFDASSVIVAELQPGRGDIGVYLGVTKVQDIGDLLKLKPQDIHRQLVERAISSHKLTGLRLLLSSFKPSDVTLLNAADQMAAIVRELARIAPYVVLDLGVGLPASTQRVLDQCTNIIVVVEPDPRTVQQSKALLEDLKVLGVAKSKIIVAMVHRVRTEQAMNAADVQKAIGNEVDVVYTPAPELAYQAARMQTSMLLTDPESFTSQQTLKLVNLVTVPGSK
jgi:pilus assembly protein CpaE